jgi:hypothetical protein
VIEQAQGGAVRIVPIDMWHVAFGVSTAPLQYRAEDADARLLTERINKLDDHGRSIRHQHLIGPQQRLQRPALVGMGTP